MVYHVSEDEPEITFDDLDKESSLGAYVGPGWQPIILALNKICKKLDSGHKIVQIKEKFGGLRYYYYSSGDLEDDVSESIYTLVSFVETICYLMCENCGSTQNVSTEGQWLKTKCDNCQKLAKVP
jgi:hypothetical protein